MCQVTDDTWQVTRDRWHVTLSVGWTFSQNFSSQALTVCDLWNYEDLEEKAHWVTELINDGGVCRTAPATPGLLNTVNPKPEELGGWNFERMIIPHHVSCVMYNMSHVTCHMSNVTCHMSRVMCHMSHVMCHMTHFILFFLLFFRQSGEAYRWRVCYQRGLPLLVFL